MLSIQNYVRAHSLEEAYELNQKRTNRIVGGMMWMRMEKTSMNTAIDLCDLGLDKLEETDTEFRIGCMCSLRALELHEGLNRYSHGAVCDALSSIVGVQFRNQATIGGSIWSVFGFSDVLTVFLAMDTYVELYKTGVMSLADFIQRKKDNDILVSVIVKKSPLQLCYLHVRNQRTDLPVLTCAVGKDATGYYACVGARPTKAMLIRDEAGLLANGLTETAIDAFAAQVSKRIHTGSNIRGSARYRKHLATVLTARGLHRLEEMT